MLSLIILYSYIGFSQNIDSLKTILKSSKDKSVIYNKISAIYKDNSELKLSKHYADSALSFAKNQNNKIEIGNALLNIGDYYYYTSNYDSALINYKMSLPIYITLNSHANIASVYSNIGTIYFSTSKYKKAVKYFKKAVKYQKLEKNPEETGVIYNNIATVYYYLDEYAKAIEFYEKSLELKKGSNDHKSIAKSINNIANVYSSIGDNNKAIELYFEAIEYCDKANDKALKSITLNNIAGEYSVWEQYDKALELYNQSLQIKKELNNLDGEANALNNIGLVYKLEKKYKKAEINFIEAKKIFEKVGNKYGLAITYNNLGSIKEEFKDYKNAINLYNKSAILSDSINSPQGMAIAYLNMSKVYLEINDIVNADLYLKECITIVNKSNLNSLKIDIYKLSSRVYEKKGNIRKAYEYFKKYTVVKDSTFSAEKHKKINEINTKYETEKQKQIIKDLALQKEISTQQIKIQQLTIQKRTWFIVGLIGLILLIGLISYFIFRHRNLKTKHRQIELEQKLLRSQMNPHFISNALGSIQQYVLANKPIDAAKYLALFTSLMRNIIKNSRNEKVNIETELQTLNNYLALQQLRFKDKFDFEISVAPNIEQEETLIPPMLAQPIIENSIKHAFKNIDYKGLIKINFTIENEEFIILTITDNGVGYNFTKDTKSDNHISYATEIINERIENQNKKSRKKYKFTVSNRQATDNKNGTYAKFIIPIEYSN